MATYDSHLAVQSIALANRVSEELGIDYLEVIGSTQTQYPTAIFTLPTDLASEAKQNHLRLCALAKTLKSPTLVETEQNLDLSRFVYEGTTHEHYEQLETQSRSSSRLHWGDIHLDIPVTADTREVRHLFDSLGYEHIIAVKESRPTPYHIVTTQFEEKSSLEGLAEQVTSIARAYRLDTSPDHIKGERLLYFDTFNDCEPLPLTVGVGTASE